MTVPNVLRRTARALFGFGARLTPRPLRFRAALRVATCVGHPLELIMSAVRGRRFRFGSGPEYCLVQLLGALDAHGLRYDLAAEVTGLDQLEAAARPKRGVLLIGTHANAALAALVVRCIDDAGLKSVAISGSPQYPIWGTGRATDAISPNTNFLIPVRSRWRAGDIVCALIDSTQPNGRHAAAVQINGVTVWLAEPLVLLAVKSGIPVVFMKASFRRGRLSIAFERCSVGGSSHQVIEHFTAFLSSAAA